LKQEKFIMFRRLIAISFLLASVPAAAGTTFNVAFGGAQANNQSFTYNVTSIGQGSLSITATPRKFFIEPSALTNISQTQVAGQVRRTLPGLGILGGGDADQIDTNRPGTAGAAQREGLLLTGNRKFSIHSLKLSFVDNTDTLQLYGVNANGSLSKIGYGSTTTGPAGNPGTIVGGLDGTAKARVCNADNDGTCTFGVAPTGLFSSYLFTTRIGGDVDFAGNEGQGYRLDGLAGALPEPGTWAMLIGGFGLAGVSLRRQRKPAAA
jgi:PEP-CTERM motif